MADTAQIETSPAGGTPVIAVFNASSDTSHALAGRARRGAASGPWCATSRTSSRAGSISSSSSSGMHPPRSCTTSPRPTMRIGAFSAARPQLGRRPGPALRHHDDQQARPPQSRRRNGSHRGSSESPTTCRRLSRPSTLALALPCAPAQYAGTAHRADALLQQSPRASRLGRAAARASRRRRKRDAHDELSARAGSIGSPPARCRRAVRQSASPG